MVLLSQQQWFFYHSPVLALEGMPAPAAGDDDFHQDVSFNVTGIPACPYSRDDSFS